MMSHAFEFFSISTSSTTCRSFLPEWHRKDRHGRKIPPGRPEVALRRGLGPLTRLRVQYVHVAELLHATENRHIIHV
jgi:hypothetical protein